MSISGNLGDDVQFFIICTELICAHELQQSFNSRMHPMASWTFLGCLSE